MTDPMTKPVLLAEQIEFLQRMKIAMTLRAKASNACALANHATALAQQTKECRDEAFASRNCEEARAREAEAVVRLLSATLETLQRAAVSTDDGK